MGQHAGAQGVGAKLWPESETTPAKPAPRRPELWRSPGRRRLDQVPAKPGPQRRRPGVPLARQRGPCNRAARQPTAGADRRHKARGGIDGIAGTARRDGYGVRPRSRRRRGGGYGHGASALTPFTGGCGSAAGDRCGCRADGCRAGGHRPGLRLRAGWARPRGCFGCSGRRRGSSGQRRLVRRHLGRGGEQAGSRSPGSSPPTSRAADAAQVHVGVGAA